MYKKHESNKNLIESNSAISPSDDGSLDNKSNLEKLSRDRLEIEEPVQQNNEMSTFSKICFGFAAMPYQMIIITIGILTIVYLLERVRLPPEKTLY
jgi:hypothetical protein